MSLDVSQFLNDSSGNFTESAPRPPVPGEENDLQSSGGTSTRSSGSHRSHLSSKSHLSIKSGSTLRPEQSPCATPRRSNLDRQNRSVLGSTLSTSHCDCSDAEAPLGFEPEGSVASSPRFTENGTPTYLKWAENLNNLLEDREGVKLFKQFMDQEQCSNLLDFWFACEGLKMSGDKQKIQSLVKLIYRKYIKGDLLPNLRSDIKRGIAESIRDCIWNQTIFNEAQQEVENSMRNDSYPAFLKSDLYVLYVQTGGDSPKTSNTSSGSNSARPMSGPLPTLTEGEELGPDDMSRSASASALSLSLTPSALIATSKQRAALSQRSLLEASYLQAHKPKRNVNPYHISYAPVSAQDSELQSLSSDALTDDTMSLTDSSVDGRDVNGKKWKRKAMQRSAQLNRHADTNSSFIPRTDRAPKDRNIAETCPEKFAILLIEKLQKVVEDQERLAKVQESIKMCETDEEDHRSMGSGPQPPRINTSINTTVNTSVAAVPINVLLTSMTEDEDNAQSILEDHCSRVWDSPAGETPGRHSPKSWSPERSFHRGNLAGPSPNVSSSSVFNKSHHKRKEKEPHLTSLQSFDSGMGEDKSGVYSHPYHHNVPKDAKVKSGHDQDAMWRSAQYFRDMSMRGHTDLHNMSYEDPGVRGRSREAKRSSAKKCSDTSSNIDSGVSVHYEPSHSSVPNLSDPANDKVLKWMIQNDRVATGTGQYSTDNSDKSSSHKRSVHSHKSAGTPAPHRQSSSKKQGSYGSRTSSLDRSLPMMSYGGQSSNAMPNQPFLQDPSMPPLNPPNPITQLEEAKRRLEDEARMAKSRSFTAPSSKERRTSGNQMPPPSLPPRNISMNTSLDLSSSERADRYNAAPKKPSVSAPATPADEVTVVGYYFCGEPIPYRTTIKGKTVTLGQFKQLISKRGTYRYFFKTASDEFDSGVILEEVTVDDMILPLWEGKIVGKVEKVE